MLLNEGRGFDNNAMINEAGTLEGDQIIMEAVLVDAGIELSEQETYDLVNSHLLSERNIVKLDKHARRALAEKKAVIVLAKEHNDPLYRKLVTVYKLKRKIILALVGKYSSKAKQRVRKNIMNAGHASKTVATKIKNVGGTVFKGADLPGKNRR